MIIVNPLEVEGLMFTAVRVELPKTNLLMIANEVGYIMCAALDVDVLNTKLKNRNVIAGRASGVRTIDDLLHAPLEKNYRCLQKVWMGSWNDWKRCIT